MYIGFFRNFEILSDNMDLFNSNEIILQNRCGKIIIEILNNYKEIEKAVNETIKYIDFSWHNNKKYYSSYSIFLNEDLKIIENLLNYEDIKPLKDYVECINDKIKHEKNKNKNKNEIDNLLIEKYKNMNISPENYIILAINHYKDILDKINKFSHFIDIFYKNNKNFYLPEIKIPNNKLLFMLFNTIRYDNSTEIIKKNEYMTLYEVKSFDDLLSIYIKQILDKNIYINKCKNCEKYFIPLKRRDTVYCNNKSPQKPEKTCKEYGAILKKRTDYKKLGEINKLSTNIKQYMKNHIKREKAKTEKEKYKKSFENFSKFYNLELREYKDNNIKKDDFINWLKDCHNNLKFMNILDFKKWLNNNKNIDVWLKNKEAKVNSK